MEEINFSQLSIYVFVQGWRPLHICIVIENKRRKQTKRRVQKWPATIERNMFMGL